MEKQKMETADMVKENIDRIGKLFPHCVTETTDKNGNPVHAIDFDKLRQELGEDIVEGKKERYQFTWPMKSQASALANTPTTMTLRPDKESSKNFDTTENLYIEGDNLEVLKVLRETYLGKVKMIYIDPPYNTGKDFVYKDNRFLTQKEMDTMEGKYDEYGNIYKTNTESNGRFHTDWLNMMYPRLKVARDLLSDDGVIFISIDDNELDNLRKLCDEIFGQDNLITYFIWEQGRKSMAAQVAINHEYCLVYSKNKKYQIDHDREIENHNWLSKKNGLDKIYKEVERLVATYGQDINAIEKGLLNFYKKLSDSDPAKAHSHYKKYDSERGLFFQGDISQGTGNGGRFPIIHPITGKPCKQPAGGWRFSESKLPELLRENRIAFGPDDTTIPCLKRYLKETEYEVCSSVFYRDGRGASKRLDALIGKGIFEYPKDEEIIENFIKWSTSYPAAESIILDFFSGSGTTAHAVMKLNAEDGGNRKFIMVQLEEETEEGSEARKAGYKNICEIGKERIRRAGEKVKEEAGLQGQDLDIGFRVLKLDSSNMKDVSVAPGQIGTINFDDVLDNVKEGRTDLDLLFQIMLNNSIPLSANIEEQSINGHKIYNVDDGDLIAVFDRSVDDKTITEIAKMQPLKFVMREPENSPENKYNPDNIIDNFEQIFDLYSPNTIRRVL